jgi:hypothetical protein
MEKPVSILLLGDVAQYQSTKVVEVVLIIDM